jgi:hypothetical protein
MATYTHPPGHYTGDRCRRRFVVSCPACSSEGHRTEDAGTRAPQPCSLCSGLGRVPRIIAERYNFSLHGQAA